MERMLNELQSTSTIAECLHNAFCYSASSVQQERKCKTLTAVTCVFKWSKVCSLATSHKIRQLLSDAEHLHHTTATWLYTKKNNFTFSVQLQCYNAWNAPSHVCFSGFLVQNFTKRVSYLVPIKLHQCLLTLVSAKNNQYFCHQNLFVNC